VTSNSNAYSFALYAHLTVRRTTTNYQKYLFFFRRAATLAEAPVLNHLTDWFVLRP